MFSVGKITKYWLILFKIEVKKNISFDPMTGKKLIIQISHKQQATEVPFHLKKKHE